MLRPVTLAVAIALAEACALDQQPVPPGMELIQVQVRNASPDEVSLTVQTDTGETGGVQPSVLAPGSVAEVTLTVPIEETWWLGGDPTNGDARVVGSGSGIDGA